MESLPINFRSATQIASEIKRGNYTSTEVVKIHLDQIKKYNEQLNAIVILREKEALARAKAADEALARGEDWGPLHGVPITLKEAFKMKGLKTTLNSKLLKDYVADRDSVVVTKLRNQGAIILGKTNVPEMLSDAQTYGPIYGTTNNPYQLDCTPGGSSGGAAVSVAAGMAAFDIGSDIGGSVRTPAHFCGLYSVKPTERSVVQDGHIPLLPGHKGNVLHMNGIGPMTRSIEDLELVFRILNGADHKDTNVAPIEYVDHGERDLSSYRIAWVNQMIGFPAEAETSSMISHLADKLKKNGAKVSNDLPNDVDYYKVLENWGILFGMIFSQDLPWLTRMLSKLMYRKWKSKIGKGIRKGVNLNFKKYAQILKSRDEIIRRFQSFFKEYDLLITPVSLTPAFPHHKSGAPIVLDGIKRNYEEAIVSSTAIFNFTGHPAIIIPLGQSSTGLPIGIQVVGPYWSEYELMKFAKKIDFLVQGFKPPQGFVSNRSVLSKIGVKV